MTIVWHERLKLGRNEKLNFPSDQNAMNINYTEDVTLENSCFDSIKPFSFEMRGAGSGQYNSFIPIFTVALLSSGCTSKMGRSS